MFAMQAIMSINSPKIGRPFKRGETVSKPVRVVLTPSEFSDLERKRDQSNMPRATFIKKLIAEAKVAAPSQSPVEVLGMTCAGDGIEVAPLPDGLTIAPDFPLPHGAFGLLVVGDSMTRASGKGNIESGSVAFFRPDSFPPPGSVVCAEWQDGARRYSTIKRLLTDETTGAMRLMPLNPEHDEIAPPDGADIEIKGVFLRAMLPRRSG